MSGSILVVALFGMAVVLFIVAALLQWLWNMTLPEIFGVKVLRYWQAFRLLLIAGLLFGSGNLLNVTWRSTSDEGAFRQANAVPSNAQQAAREDARA